MEKNKVTTYMFYAIGEIILVVIGILIAVSLNNWNQRQKQREVEIEYMARLKEEFQANKELLENKKMSLEAFLKEQKKLLDVHQLDSPMSTKEMIAGIERSGFAEGILLRKDVWKDIYSTGNVLIFTNLELQEQMSKFYNNSAPVFEDLLSELDAFRLKTREKSMGIIDPKTRSDMVESWIIDEFDKFLQTTSIDAAEIKRRFQQVPEVGNYLADQIMLTKVALMVAIKDLEEIDEIVNLLESEIRLKS